MGALSTSPCAPNPLVIRGLFSALLLLRLSAHWLCLEPIAPPDLQQRKQPIQSCLLTHPGFSAAGLLWTYYLLTGAYPGYLLPSISSYTDTDIKMWSWFGGAAAQKRKDAPKNAILQLREQLDMLQKRERHLETQISEQEAMARKNVNSDKNGMVADLADCCRASI